MFSPNFMHISAFCFGVLAGFSVFQCVAMETAARWRLDPYWNSLCCLICVLCTLHNLSKKSPRSCAVTCPKGTTRDPLVDYLTDTCSKLSSQIHALQSANADLVSCLQSKVRHSKQSKPAPSLRS